MTDEEVLRMPLRRFWLMQTNIGRISAAEELRQLHLQIAAKGGEQLQEYQEKLIGEIGNVHRVDEKLDREGVQRLAALA